MGGVRSGRLRIVAWIAWTAVTLVLLVGAGTGSRDCPGAHLHLELAGSSEALDALLSGPACGDLDAAGLRTGLWFDLGFIVVFFPGLAVACRALAERGWRARRLRRLGSTLAPLALGAGVLDLAEDAALLTGLPPSGPPSLDDVHAVLASAFAWPKFLLLAAVLAFVLASTIGWLRLRRLPQPASPAEPDEPATLGVCFSGGGVRSATYASGAIQAFHDADLWDRVDVVAAVSGGSYLASAAAIAQAEASPDAKVFSHGSPESHWLEAHQNYLTTGPGGLLGVAWAFVWRLAAHLAVLGIALWLLSVPVGWLASSPWVQPGIRGPGDVSLRLSLWLPGLWVGAAGIWLLPVRGWGRRFGVALLAAGLALEGLLVAVPLAIHAVPDLYRDLGSSLSTQTPVSRLAQAIAGVGVLGALGRLLWRRVSGWAPRLGGVAVIVLAVLLGGEFATNAARSGVVSVEERLLDPTAALWSALLAVFVLASRIDPHLWSFHGFYRKRLRTAYATRRTPDGGIEALPEGAERTLDGYAAERGPEVVICAAAQVSAGADTNPRVPAVSVTFGRRGVGLTYADVDAEPMRFLGHPRRTIVADAPRFAALARALGKPHLARYSGAAALSGAAVASAMGRHSLGTTNAFLAALNLDLGGWVPNPMYAASAEGGRYPRPRLGSVLKELVGLYDVEDAYLFVTDGGHWENLGLVELVRRGCRDILCFDAAGTRSDSFATFAEAVELGFWELGAILDVDWEPMRTPSDALGRVPPQAPSDVAVGVVRYPDGRVGTLFYAKAAVTPDAPPLVRAYAETERDFPFHSTADQSFDERQFTGYRDLGRHTAGVVTGLYARWLAALENGTPDDLPAALSKPAEAFEEIRRWPATPP